MGFRKRQRKVQVDVGESGKEIVTIKCLLRSVLRSKYRDLVTKFIEQRSIQATKMLHLGSLFFLNEVQLAFDQNRIEYFQCDGEMCIRECVRAVLNQNINQPGMNREFRILAEANGIIWPKNDYFGNATGDLIDVYITNEKNNLNMHCDKRLRNYLKLRVHQNNLNERRRFTLNDEDVKHAVNWATKQYDSIVVQNMDDMAKRDRREYLLQMIREISWFVIPNDDLKTFTKVRWFESLPLWLTMQRALDAMNLQKQRDHELEKRGKKEKPAKPKRDEFKNLKVTPICNTQRKHFPMDTFGLYKMMCATKTISLDERGNQISSNYVSNIGNE